MKSASTQDRTEYILYDVVNGSRSKPIARLQYSQDRGTSFYEFGDVKNITFSSRNNNKQYNKFILVPPSTTLNADFDNSQSKYSPGGSGEFADILKRNLLINSAFGYQMDDPAETTINIGSTESLITYHTQTGGSVIKNDVTSEVSFTSLNGVTDNWNFYDGQNYDSTTYSPEGYWLSNITNYPDLWGALQLNELIMTSDSTGIFVYYRASDVETNLTNDITPFTLLGETASGSNTFTLPSVTEKYFQFCIVFDTGAWGTGTISNMQLKYSTYYEYFDAGEFLVDNASFTADYGNYSASIACRDKFKKALETAVSCPSYTSSTDVAKILRDVADRAGISHNDGSELIADTGYTVTIADADNFKNVNAISIFNEVMIYLNWKNNNYRLELNIDGNLQLVIKDSDVNNADWQLDYRFNLLSISKQYESDKLLQRITVLAKDHPVDTETQLATQNYTTTQDDTDLTWANASIYKRVEVTVNSGDGVFTLNSTSNTGINFDITGTSIDVDVTVYGDELQTSPPFIGEDIYYTNSEFSDGITHTLTNRLVQSDAEAQGIAESLSALYGNPEFSVSVNLPYNPLIELGDRLLIWEKYTNTNTIYRVDAIGVNYSADNASMYMTMQLTDLGSDFTNFGWDRHNKVNGGTLSGTDDIKYDTGLLWDQDLGVDVTEDTTDYSYLKPVRFS